MDTHISLASAHEIFQICRPLVKYLNIAGFEYACVYADGSRTELSTNAEYLEHTFIKKKYFVDVYTPDLLPDKGGYLFPDDWVNVQPLNLQEKLKLQLKYEKERFRFDNSFCIVKRCPNFAEYFLFFGCVGDTSIKHLFLSNVDLLEQFILYFKSQARALIDKADKDKLVLPWREKSKESIITNVGMNFLKDHKPRRYFLRSKTDVYLTAKEIECIAYVLMGCTAAEAAKLMFLSNRTVEKHIDNIKLKLKFSNKIELRKILIDNGLEKICEYVINNQSLNRLRNKIS